MLIVLSGASSPDRFAADCMKIVQEQHGHKAHRSLDLLTNQVLSSLGYGRGIEIFEAAVRDWHQEGMKYPNTNEGE
jgi:hypothetical protein